MKIKAVNKRISDRFALDVPELDLETGKIYAVMGANGSGKSTLAKEIAFGKLVPAGVTVGYMPQKNYAFRMSVRKNALLSGASEEKVIGMLSRLGMDAFLHDNAKKLSGGETAKLALVRTLGKHFDLLILDEPTAAMDIESALEAERMIEEYCNLENAAVILITHSTGQAERLAGELLFMYKGKLLESGDPGDVLNDPKSKEAKAFFSF